MKIVRLNDKYKPGELISVRLTDIINGEDLLPEGMGLYFCVSNAPVDALESDLIRSMSIKTTNGACLYRNDYEDIWQGYQALWAPPWDRYPLRCVNLGFPFKGQIPGPLAETLEFHLELKDVQESGYDYEVKDATAICATGESASTGFSCHRVHTVCKDVNWSTTKWVMDTGYINKDETMLVVLFTRNGKFTGNHISRADLVYVGEKTSVGTSSNIDSLYERAKKYFGTPEKLPMTKEDFSDTGFCAIFDVPETSGRAYISFCAETIQDEGEIRAYLFKISRE